MAIQQLDLFGNPVIIPTAKEEEVKVKPAKKQEATGDDDSPKSFPLYEEKAAKATTGITVIHARGIAKERGADSESLNEPDNEVVYSDNRIRVKLKAGRTQKDILDDEALETAEILSSQIVRKSLAGVSGSIESINVPDDETLNKKMYYKISVVADWFGVNNSLIRFWENEFDILKPRLTRKGDRLFRVEDIKNLQLIYQLLKVRKFSIEGAKAYLKQNKQKANVHMELAESLGKIRTFLVELKGTLNT